MILPSRRGYEFSYTCPVPSFFCFPLWFNMFFFFFRLTIYYLRTSSYSTRCVRLVHAIHEASPTRCNDLALFDVSPLSRKDELPSHSYPHMLRPNLTPTDFLITTLPVTQPLDNRGTSDQQCTTTKTSDQRSNHKYLAQSLPSL